jgi:hypothetical protein
MKPKKKKIDFQKTKVLKPKWLPCCSEDVQCSGDAVSVRCGTCVSIENYDEHKPLVRWNYERIRIYGFDQKTPNWIKKGRLL